VPLGLGDSFPNFHFHRHPHNHIHNILIEN
jgi:hypothetical protein